MRVAATAIDITPHSPIKLCGYINDVRNNQRTQTAHKPIYASVLRIVLEERQLLFITLDILSITKERGAELKKAITAKYPIQEEEIFLHAIHTHSGPSGFSVDAMGKEYEDNRVYREDVISRIQTGLYSVFEKTKSVQAFLGKTHIHGFYDNRNDAHSYFDDEAYVLQFRQGKKVVAEYINLSVHSTVLGPYNMEISYDLLGTIREKIASQYHICPIITLGTAADISNRHFRQGDDFQELERTAEGIYKQLADIQNFQKVDMERVTIQTFTYTIAYDNRQYYSQYQKELAQIEQALHKEEDTTKRKLLLSSKDKFLSKLGIQDVHKKLIIHLLHFPDLLIVTFPGELTSIFGKYIKEHAQEKYTMIMTCTDDHHGYFIEQELYGKCYEATATLIPKGESEKIITELGEYL